MLKTPQFCNKASLLKCVDMINKTCALSPKMQLKTKTLPEILEAFVYQLEEINPMLIIEDTPQYVLCEMVIWGLLDIEFLGEEIPDQTQKILDQMTDDTRQAPARICWDEANEKFTAPDGGTVVEFDKKEDDLTTALDDAKLTIEDLVAKLAKAEKNGKAKKIEKITTQLDEAKAQLNDLKKVAQKPPEKKVDPRIVELKEAIKTLLDNMPEKKKKAKKVKAKIAELEAELAGLEDLEPEKPKKVKPAVTGSTTRGATARANRTIPETISWPKPDSITGTIVSYCQKEPRTVTEIIKKLAKEFPDRAVEGMTKTVGALVGGKGEPLPLHYTKGIPCEVENDGSPEKTIFIPVSE